MILRLLVPADIIQFLINIKTFFRSQATFLNVKRLRMEYTVIFGPTCIQATQIVHRLGIYRAYKVLTQLWVMCRDEAFARRCTPCPFAGTETRPQPKSVLTLSNKTSSESPVKHKLPRNPKPFATLHIRLLI